MKNLKFETRNVDEDIIEVDPGFKIIKEILDKNINDVVLEDENGNIYLGIVRDGSYDPAWGPNYLQIEFK